MARDIRTRRCPAPTSACIAPGSLKRSCVLVVAKSRIDVVGDPTTRRWRFTLQLVFQEIAATWARRTDLDLHSAAIEAGGIERDFGALLERLRRAELIEDAAAGIVLTELGKLVYDRVLLCFYPERAKRWLRDWASSPKVVRKGVA